MLGVVEEGQCGVEIGRDAAAFFSDLDFGFLLMHYICAESNLSLSAFFSVDSLDV